MNLLLTTLNLVAAWVIVIAGVLAIATLLIVWAWWLFNSYVKFTKTFSLFLLFVWEQSKGQSSPDATN